MPARRLTLEQVEDRNKSARNCLAYTFRCFSFCGILFGTLTLLFNLIQVGEIQFGNPEGDMNLTSQ